MYGTMGLDMGIGMGLGMGLELMSMGIIYSYITMIITLVIAAYVMSGVETAKSCIRVFSILQFFAVIIGFAVGFEACAMAVMSSIPLYIFMFVLWKFCDSKEHNLSAYQQITLNKAMYNHFVRDTNKE